MNNFYLRRRSILYLPGFFAALFFFSSCGQNLQDKAIELGQDGKIKKEELRDFINLVSDKTDHGDPQFYTANKIDTNKVITFITSTCEAAGIRINKEDVYSGSVKPIPPKGKPSFNVYMEDSESMDAYVNGQTGFKDAVYSLLGNVINSDGAFTGTNLYYINNQITFRQQNASSNTLLQFIQNLDPQTFRKNGGNRSSSDMRRLFQQVLDSTDDRHVNMLVSDFVFSPGRGQNAALSLQQQSTGIKISFAQKIQHFDLAVEVIQLRSNVSGKYFDENDRPTVISGNRPFYIWLFGPKAEINAIRKNGLLNNIKGGVDHSLVVYKQAVPLIHAHKLLYTNKQGEFEMTDGASGDIHGAKPGETNNIFAFDFLVDYSKDMEDLAFYDDTANYVHDHNYKLTINRLTAGEDPANASYTHRLHLSTTALDDQDLHVYTKAEPPRWVMAGSSMDDRNIRDPLEMRKTFGLQYLIQGVYDAFYAPPHQNKSTEVQITVKK
ncbi:hypothetical protein FO440_22275 [Mucilaginibacter corticis]|uniref:Uncharacterized protein n=1 Tax=Mucilaginibacter corticis TaxID=2597670 RepID=A0A556M9K0_9SPHI|nr:hypothetical protein [Mucilaginibacter corticis]TSJ36558.1 hypothetical protein FO440_22275 [Mucilaginibacter corticis]